MLELLYRMQRYKTASVYVKGKQLRAQLADSFVKHMLGLMFRRNIGKDECMLFVFSRESRQGIWMRNMRFPIDVMWIGRGNRVVDLVENATPSSRQIYKPCEDSKYVLETNAGFIKRNRIKKGEAVRIAL